MFRIQNVIYSILFPAGFQTIFLSLYLFLAITIIFFLQICYIKKNSTETLIPLKSNFRTLLFILIVGLFFPILMGSYASFIFITFFLQLSKSVKKSKSACKLVLVIILAIFGIAFIAQLALWAFLYFWYSKSTGFVLILGIFAGLLISIFNQNKKIPHHSKFSQFHFVMSQKAKVGVLFIGVIGTGLFFPLTLLHPHTTPSSNTTISQISIDIMTYNIRNPGSMEKDSANLWNNRKQYTANYIKSFDLDIFGVQEAYSLQLLYLQNQLTNRNYAFYGVGRDEGTIGGEIEAIFWDRAKYTYIDGDTFWLSDTPSIPSKNWDKSNYRTCTWIRFEEIHTNFQFFVFNTHFSAHECTDIPCVQQKSAELINAKIFEITGDLPVVLLGDFNMQNTSAAFAYLENYGEKPLQDSYKSFNNGTVPFDYTTNEFKPFDSSLDMKRIDYIFHSESITIENFEIPKDYYGENRPYSDHYPVVAQIHIG